MESKEIARNYRFLAILLGAMIVGCIVGWAAPEFALKLKPFGTVFINMMFYEFQTFTRSILIVVVTVACNKHA